MALDLLPNSHGSTDDFTHTGHQKINRLCQSVVFLASRHVERLDLSRKATEQNGLSLGQSIPRSTSTHLSYLVSHRPFWLFGNVLVIGQGFDAYRCMTHLSKLIKGAIVLSDVVFSQVLDALGVVHSPDGSRRRLEVRVELLDKMVLWVVDHVVDNTTDLQVVNSVRTTCAQPSLRVGSRVPQSQ